MKLISSRIKSFLKTALIATSFATAGVTSAQTNHELTVAEAIRWIGFLPMYVAQEKGQFSSQGLTVKLVTAGGRALAVQTVISGQADISAQDPAGATQALKQGADIRLFMPLLNRNLIYMVGPKTAQEGDKLDVRGMRIAVATPPSSPHNVLTNYLRSKGYEEVDRSTWRPKGVNDTKQYVRLLFVGFFQELPPVAAGQADAAVVLTPYESLGVQDMGLKVTYSWAQATGPFLLTAFSASSERMRTKAPAFQAFSQAMAQTYTWMYQNPQEVGDIAVKWFPKMNPQVVREAAARMLSEGAIPKSVQIGEAEYRANIFDLAAKAGDPGANVPFADAVSNSFSGQGAAK